MIAAILAILLLLPAAAAPPGRVPVYLVHGAAAPWTPDRAATAVAALDAALAWWEVQTGNAPPRLAPPVTLEVADPYDRAAWMGLTPGIYLVARGPADPTFTNGRSGWARPGGWRLAALETPARPDATLAALLAHEWGHARYGLADVDEPGDIMGPGYPAAYAAGRVGCRSGRALGGACVFLPSLRGAP